MNLHTALITSSYATRHYWVNEGLSFLQGKLLRAALAVAVRDDLHRRS